MLATLLGLTKLATIFCGMGVAFGVAGIATTIYEDKLDFGWGGLICALIWILL